MSRISAVRLFGVVVVILPPKTWRKLEQKVQNIPAWVVALSGALEQFVDGKIVLKHPTVQFFEKKEKSKALAETPAAESNRLPSHLPAEDDPQSKQPDLPASGSLPQLTLKDRHTA
ncbi:MAG: hypothetical protein KDJ34_17260 [Candidatus Competibacteraceae bacterium]|nr:hypothetical protein [Candidatus Competibacteraceae bacterium]